MRRVRKHTCFPNLKKKKSKNIWLFPKLFISLHRQLKNKLIMNKFDKLVELAKNSVENKIIEDVGYSGIVFLPTNGENLILRLGGEWYHNLLLSVGYSHRTIDRKVENMEFDKLASALDDWYKTEIYPKLYNRFQSEGRKILDC